MIDDDVLWWSNEEWMEEMSYRLMTSLISRTGAQNFGGCTKRVYDACNANRSPFLLESLNSCTVQSSTQP